MTMIVCFCICSVHFCLHDANNEVGGGNKVAISGDSPSLGKLMLLENWLLPPWALFATYLDEFAFTILSRSLNNTGMWAAEEAVVLDRDAHDPRRYKTPKPIDLPMDTKVQYKYLVQRQDKTVVSAEWYKSTIIVGYRTILIYMGSCAGMGTTGRSSNCHHSGLRCNGV